MAPDRIGEGTEMALADVSATPDAFPLWYRCARSAVAIGLPHVTILAQERDDHGEQSPVSRCEVVRVAAAHAHRLVGSRNVDGVQVAVTGRHGLYRGAQVADRCFGFGRLRVIQPAKPASIR